jgi:hypothetical protein
VTQNPKNKKFLASKIDVGDQPAFVMADGENDAGADAIRAAKGLSQLLEARPLRSARDQPVRSIGLSTKPISSRAVV